MDKASGINVKKLLASGIDEALGISGNLFKLIKDYKKSMMSQFLGIDENANILEIYESGFSSSSWEAVRLQELAATDGISQGPQDESFYKDLYSETGYPLIVQEHINSLRFQPDELEYIAGDAVPDFEKFITQGGDIIMLQDGDDTGASALVPFMHENSMLGPRMIRIRLNADLCEVFYILNILHFYYNTGIMKNLAKRIPGSITIPVISEMPVPLPPVEKQKQIADSMLKLSTGMVAQENYNREILKLRKVLENC